MAAQADIRHSHAAANGPAGYQRRQPEEKLLYQIVLAHWQQFLADIEAEVALLEQAVRLKAHALGMYTPYTVSVTVTCATASRAPPIRWHLSPRSALRSSHVCSVDFMHTS